MNRKGMKLLDITFHNPNTPEQTVNYMVKVFVQEIYHQKIDKPNVNLTGKEEDIVRGKSEGDNER